jgi:hypothetical protein
MKRILNDSTKYVDEPLDGLCLAYPDPEIPILAGWRMLEALK